MDWGSAHPIGRPRFQYSGTTNLASVSILRHLANQEPTTPTAADDLESLVYSVYTLLGSHCVTKANGLEKHQYALIADAWEEETEQNQFLAELVSLARNTRYDDLRHIFLQSVLGRMD